MVKVVRRNTEGKANIWFVVRAWVDVSSRGAVLESCWESVGPLNS